MQLTPQTAMQPTTLLVTLTPEMPKNLSMNFAEDAGQDLNADAVEGGTGARDRLGEDQKPKGRDRGQGQEVTTVAHTTAAVKLGHNQCQKICRLTGHVTTLEKDVVHQYGDAVVHRVI